MSPIILNKSKAAAKLPLTICLINALEGCLLARARARARARAGAGARRRS
jgi:hypothetical protein